MLVFVRANLEPLLRAHLSLVLRGGLRAVLPSRPLVQQLVDAVRQPAPRSTRVDGLPYITVCRRGPEGILGLINDVPILWGWARPPPRQL
jgi:hypothetical protein